ncbi:DMT family transporter [Consotaella aegiceratis]|uniref:DMT family transporter n=1 Tax=Consotaella aegiceratis TaxID=3097961 RepID=UPI002F41337E
MLNLALSNASGKRVSGVLIDEIDVQIDCILRIRARCSQGNKMKRIFRYKSTASTAFGSAAGMATVLVWSLAAPVVTYAVGIDPFLYVALGDGIGATVFLLTWLRLRQNPLPELKGVPVWFYGLGLIGIGVHNLTWVAALQQAPPLEATLLVYTWPLLVIIFTTVSLGQKFQWYHLVAGVVGLAGIVALLMGRGLGFGSFQLAPGHIWAIVSALSWSIFSAISARYPYQSSNFLGVVFFLSSIINGSIWFFVQRAPSAPAQSLLIAGVAAIFFTCCYAMWDFSMKHGNTQLVGVVSFLTPVLSTVYLVLFGMAELTGYLIVSLMLVITGIGIAKYGESIRIAIIPLSG